MNSRSRLYRTSKRSIANVEAEAEVNVEAEADVEAESEPEASAPEEVPVKPGAAPVLTTTP